MPRNKTALAAAALCAALVFSASPAQAAGDAPVTIDSRIRTLVYSPNEVFKMYTEYGYQSNIEFSEEEQIATISLGSPSMFKIIPSGNRIFVKALQKDRHTNMTVVTTKRAYQFELFSTPEAERDVIYVMRFYYPEDNIDDTAATSAAETASKAAVTESAKPKTPEVQPEKPKAEVKENYNYSLAGPERISPVRVYDNGVATFFKFSEGSAPKIFGVNPEGYEYPLSARRQGDLLVVDGVLPKFSVREGSDVVCVFNESAGGAR